MGYSRNSFHSFYNKHRPERLAATAVNLSGWPYIFTLVLIATLTWLPAELIMETCSLEGLKKKLFILLIASLIFTPALLLLAQIEFIAKWIFLPVQDNFYKKCIEWDNKEVVMTLKNGKTYQGLLWKYPENPKSRHESQTISIVPFKSGYRKKETKEVVWNTYYPKYENHSDLIDMEVIIPRTEIITFRKFSRKTFEHFENQNNCQHKKRD